MSGCTLTIPFHPHTPPNQAHYYPNACLQAPKIYVMQLSAPLCSAAGEDPRHSLIFCPDNTQHTLTPEDRGKTNSPNIAKVTLNESGAFVILSEPPRRGLCTYRIPDKGCVRGMKRSHQQVRRLHCFCHVCSFKQ